MVKSEFIGRSGGVQRVLSKPWLVELLTICKYSKWMGFVSFESNYPLLTERDSHGKTHRIIYRGHS